MKIDGFKPLFLALSALCLFAASGSAFAHVLKKADGSIGCDADGSTCYVYCSDNGELAGTMNWNGSVWTDGVKSDPDQDAMARLITAANGTACN